VRFLHSSDLHGNWKGHDPEHKHGSAVVILHRGGQILLLERGPTDPWMPGHWCFPGGGLDRKESPQQGALRELREEAGVFLQPWQLEHLGMAMDKGKPVYFFAAEAPTRRIRLVDGEHSDFSWVWPDEVQYRDTIPYVQEAVEVWENR